jgi:peroxiredoxin
MIDWFNATPLRRNATAIIFLAAAAAILWSAKESSLYVDIELLSVSEMAPNFNLLRMDGREQRLDTMKGNVIWIIFGNTENSGTQQQLKEAEIISDRYKDQDLRILLLVQKQEYGEVKQFVDSNKCTAAILFDSTGAVAERYHAVYMPTSFIIDKTGKIQGFHRGVWRAKESELNRIIEEYLKSGSHNNPKVSEGQKKDGQDASAGGAAPEKSDSGGQK